MTARFTSDLYLTAFTSFIIVKHVSATNCELNITLNFWNIFVSMNAVQLPVNSTAYHRDIHM